MLSKKQRTVGIIYRPDSEALAPGLESLAKKLNYNNMIQICDRHCEELSQKLPNIEQWQVPNLSINGSVSLPLIRNLSWVSFPQLKNLSLSNNNLKSIDGLNRINAPLLQRINLQKNHITNVQNLRKIQTQITSIDLNSNDILQADCFSQLSWPTCKTIYFELTKRNAPQLLNSKPLLKINFEEQSKQINILIQSSKRINQRKLLKKLIQKNATVRMKIWTKNRTYERNPDFEDEMDQYQDQYGDEQEQEDNGDDIE